MTGAPVRELKRIVDERVGPYLPPPEPVMQAVQEYHEALAATAAESSLQSGMPYGATLGPFGPYTVPLSQRLGPPVSYAVPHGEGAFAYSTPHGSVFGNPAERSHASITGVGAQMAQQPPFGTPPTMPQAAGPFRYQ